MTTAAAPPATPAHRTARSSRLAVLALLVALGCALAYLPGLQGPLFFDDLPHLTDNAQLTFSGRLADDWRAAILSAESGLLRRPVAMFTFALNKVATGELSPFALKATNLGIHVLTGVVLYHLFRLLLAAPALAALQLTKERRGQLALFAAALWLLNPLHVSTVLYVVQRMAQLSALFTLLGLLVYAHYRRRWLTQRPDPGEILAAGLWLLLLTGFATLAKENGALLPWLVAVAEVFLFRGVWGGQANARLNRLAWLVFLLPLVLGLLVFAVDPGVLEGRYDRREFTLSERLLTQSRLLWSYLFWLLVPNLSNMGFHHDDFVTSTGLLQPVTTLLSLLAWVAAVVLALLLRHRVPLLAFALFFYLVAHSMESSVWPLEMVYEHRNYLPSAAIFLFLAVALYQFARWRQFTRPGIAAAGVLAVFLLPLAFRAWVWSDEIDLARHNVINHPDSPRANFFYANSLFKAVTAAADGEMTQARREAYLVASRNHFERMYQLDRRDFAAPVMLYQIDNTFFPALPDRPDWLAVLADLADSRRLQTSDVTALGSLVAYVGSIGSAEDRDRVLQLIDALLRRYPDRPDLAVQRYALLAAGAAAERDELLAVLTAARDRFPQRRRTFPHLVQHYGSNNLADVYVTAGEWMAADSFYMELGVLRRIFSQ